MEPSNFGGNFPRPNNSGEQFAAPDNFSHETNNISRTPETAPPIPEVAPLNGIEKLSNPEQNIAPKPSAVTNDDEEAKRLAKNNDPLNVSSVTAPISAAKNPSPATAADEDLIEKEWVDKAKNIISETKNDPYEQEKRVAALMRDYVMKRYGREIGKAPEE